jgi:hypothetical protein
MGVFVAAGNGGLFGGRGVTFGPDGNLYATSSGTTGRVLKYDGTTGAFLGAFVGPGSDLSLPRGLTFGPKAICMSPIFGGGNVDRTVRLARSSIRSSPRAAAHLRVAARSVRRHFFCSTRSEPRPEAFDSPDDRLKPRSLDDVAAKDPKRQTVHYRDHQTFLAGTFRCRVAEKGCGSR